jgi:hypothetical protein
MGYIRAPIFVKYMEHRLPVEIVTRIFQLARVSEIPYVQWEDAPISVRIFQPNGNVTRVCAGDFISTSFPMSFCFRIDEWKGDWVVDGPTCFTYTIFDMKTRELIEHAFSWKMGTKRHIVCYPFGIMKYGNHLNKEAWSALVRIPDPRCH